MIDIDLSGMKYWYIHVPVADQPKFAELIQRGANLWPDAPPEIKEFADLVTNGRVLQDYYAQNKDQRKIHHTPEQLEGVAK